MKIVVCDNQELSKTAAKIVAEVISGKKVCLGLATGSTPEAMYDCLVELFKAGKCDFSGVTTFNLDEYYPISPDNPQSYRYYMDKRLFEHVNIDKSATHIPSGMASDPELECAEYEKMIAACGGIDLQVLGVGANGHIGFNEPGDALIPQTHLTELTPSTIKANARFFKSEAQVPKLAITMGMRSILSARRIVALASGSVKHEAIKKLLEGKITTRWPVTFLNLHNDVTLICDKEAYYGTT
ncbi:MAG: glucosamine-6-phosphate deaminase [Eubacteriales bacterium]